MIAAATIATGATRPEFTAPQGLGLAFSKVLWALLNSLGSAFSDVGGFFKEQVGERFANLFGDAGSFSTNKQVAARAVTDAAGNMGQLVAQLAANLGSNKAALAQIRQMQAQGLLTEFDDERNAAYQQLAEQQAIDEIESEQVIYGASAMARVSGRTTQQGKALNREESLKLMLKKMYTLGTETETIKNIKDSQNLSSDEKKMLLEQLKQEKKEYYALSDAQRNARKLAYTQEMMTPVYGKLGMKRIDNGVEIDIQKFKQGSLTNGSYNSFCMYVDDVTMSAAIAGSRVDLQKEYAKDKDVNVDSASGGVKSHTRIPGRIAADTLKPGEEYEFQELWLNKKTLNAQQQQVIIETLERGIPLMLTDDSAAEHKQLIYGYSRNNDGNVTFKIHDPGYTENGGYHSYPMAGENANRLVYNQSIKGGGTKPVADRRVQVIRYYHKKAVPSF